MRNTVVLQHLNVDLTSMLPYLGLYLFWIGLLTRKCRRPWLTQVFFLGTRLIAPIAIYKGTFLYVSLLRLFSNIYFHLKIEHTISVSIYRANTVDYYTMYISYRCLLNVVSLNSIYFLLVSTLVVWLYVLIHLSGDVHKNPGLSRIFLHLIEPQ